MNKFLSAFLLVIPFTSAFAQSQGTGKSDVSQPQKQWYGQELFLKNIQYGSENPVSFTYNPYSQLNDFNISYSKGEGSFIPVDGAGKSGLTDVNIYGVKKAGKIAFEGSLYYGVHQLDKSRWNSTVLLSPNNPFIVADSLVYYTAVTHEDSIPNNQNREIFNLNGGFSWQTGKFLIGLRANYQVGSKADQSDPRYEAHGARVKFNPGFQYSLLERMSIGLSLEYQTYHENIRMHAEDHLFPGHETTFFLQEIGNYVTEQSCSRRYDGTQYGGNLQLTFSGDRISDFLEAGYHTNNENADDGSTSYTRHGGDYSETTVSFKNRLQYTTDNVIHNLTVAAGMVNGSSRWYKQTPKTGEFGQTLYEIVSKEIVQKQKEMYGNLSYRLDFIKAQRPLLSVMLNGGYKDVSVNEYPDEYYMKYTLANAGIDVSNYLYFSRLSFKVSADFDYSKDISALDYDLPGSTGKSRVMKSYYIPKYEYLAAGYWNGGLSVDGSHRINRENKSSVYFKFGGAWHLCKYTGEYSRFQDRSLVEIMTSLLF